MLGKEEWSDLTGKRLKRWKVSRSEWDKRAARLQANPTAGACHTFCQQHGIRVSRDKSLPYGTRVKLAAITMIYAIKAEDESDFRRMIDDEIKEAAQAIGIDTL